MKKTPDEIPDTVYTEWTQEREEYIVNAGYEFRNTSTRPYQTIGFYPKHTIQGLVSNPDNYGKYMDWEEIRGFLGIGTKETNYEIY